MGRSRCHRSSSATALLLPWGSRAEPHAEAAVTHWGGWSRRRDRRRRDHVLAELVRRRFDRRVVLCRVAMAVRRRRETVRRRDHGGAAGGPARLPFRVGLART